LGVEPVLDVSPDWPVESEVVQAQVGKRLREKEIVPTVEYDVELRTEVVKLVNHEAEFLARKKARGSRIHDPVTRVEPVE
jgi:hypothetical protein